MSLDNAFALIDGPVDASLEVFDEDTNVEPAREAFIRKTLQKWEEEYAEQKSQNGGA